MSVDEGNGIAEELVADGMFFDYEFLGVAAGGCGGGQVQVGDGAEGLGLVAPNSRSRTGY